MPATLKLDAFLPYRLSIASNRVSDAIADTYRSLFKLRIPEWRLIAVLAESEGLSQQAIGQRTQMDKVTVSRATTALAERQLVTRGRNPVDQRSHVLTLTPAGKALYREVAPKALEIEARIFASLSTDDRRALLAVLERLEAAVEQLSDAPDDPCS